MNEINVIYMKFFLHVFFILIIISSSFGQNVIITYQYEVDDGHGSKYYYWFVDLDKDTIELMPFYFDGFSKDKLERCRKGNPIDLFFSTTQTNWNYSEEYKNKLSDLKSIIQSERELLYSAKIKGSEGSDKLNIYYSVVDLNICKCEISGKSADILDYNRNIALPLDYSLINPDLIKSSEVEYKLGTLNLVFRNFFNTL